MVSDRNDQGTSLVCVAKQHMNNDDITDHLLYKTSVKHSVNVVYPPQPLDDVFVTGDLNSTASVNLVIDSNPLPYFSDIIWNIVSEEGQVQVSIFMS